MARSSEAERLGRYRGEAGAARHARRREQLLDAGLEMFGTAGFAASSVKAVCAQAGLTERYFYESFRDREDLLFAVYERVVAEVLVAAVAAVEAAVPTVQARTRAGLTAFLGILTEDERKARVQSLEVVGVSERLEIRRRQTIHAFAAFMAAEAATLHHADAPPVLDPHLTSVGLVGATNEILIEWVLSQQRPSVGELVEVCAGMFIAVAETAFNRT